MALTRKRLAALRDFVIQEGGYDYEDVGEFLQIFDRNELKEIGDQLRQVYPEDFGDVDEDPDEDEDGEDAEEEVAEKSRVVQYSLVNDRNFLENLEIVRETAERVILRKSVPKDLVTVIVKGEQVTVDLIKLRSIKPDEVMHGVTVARLIELAEIAKG